MNFVIASVNNAATYLFWASFIAFLVFTVHGIALYKPAFWVMVVSLVIATATPNKEERAEFFKTAAEKVESPVSSSNK
jgi:hypothetical protein